MDDVVGGKFKIGRIIGSGTFGVIHEGVNIESGEKVAIKLEPANTEYPLLEHESEMYKHLDGGSGIPNLKWFGVEGEHSIIVIDLLGQSLADLLGSCGGKFCSKTVLMLAAQLIVIVEYIHSRGVVHRDIKPGNLLMGLGSNADQVYLVDFGLAGLYKDPITNEHIPYREGKSFMGTYRYASMFTHYGVGELFMAINIFIQGLSAGNDEEEYNKLLFDIKYKTPFEELCKSYADAFKDYIGYCRCLKFMENPHYRFLRNIFLDDFEHLGYQFDHIYDWTLPQKDGKTARRNRRKNKKKGNTCSR